MNSLIVTAIACGTILAGTHLMAADEKPAAVPSNSTPVAASAPLVVIETSMGTIKAELWPDKAPETVANFLKYADDKFYDDLIFHRVMSGFMIQGGGFTADMKEKTARAQIKNEARTNVSNERGTLAMARRGDPDSATCQFFINHANNSDGLDKGKASDGFGYCVFGKVIEGMDVVDKIAGVKTGNVKGFADVPLTPVTIKRIRRAEATPAK